jgi:LCP family protein required for cell wall assembly
MDKKINLLNHNSGQDNGQKLSIKTPPNKRRVKLFSYILIFTVVGLFLFSFSLNQTEKTEQTTWVDRIPIVGQIKHLVESADNDLKGENRGVINILLLGMGGKNHEGGYLTDTIILASLDIEEKKVAMLSIPRDMSIPVEGMGWKKINSINAYAEVQETDSGGLAISQALSDVLGVPIDYYLRVDFAGFVKIIDEIGGIEIDVENTIDDPMYPIMGNEDAPWEERFEHLYIASGLQEMDGELALKYARSRHSTGIEGSDFGRAKRQQKILQAVKDKIISRHIIFKPTMAANIIKDVEEHFSTNLKLWEVVKLWDIFKDINSDAIANYTLSDAADGLLTSMITEDGAYVLIPRSGDFSEIEYFINNFFEEAPAQSKAVVTEEKATLEVRNGTWVNGLASQVALDLAMYGYRVIRVGNCSRQNFEKTVIYDLTYGEKIDSLAILKDRLDANVSLGLPQWLMDDLAAEISTEENPIQPDFIIILGQNADKTQSGTINSEL